MKRSFAILLLLCGLASVAPGQKVTVSEPISIRNDIAFDLIGDLRGQFLLFREQIDGFEVQGFDEQMKLSWSKEIDFQRRRPQIMSVVGNDDHFFVTFTHKESGTTLLRTHCFDPGANLVDTINITDLGSAYFNIPLRSLLSEDKNILVIYRILRQKEIHAMAVNLRERRVLWETLFAPEDMVLQRDYSYFLVDNSGNLFFILEKENRKAKAILHYLEFYEFGPRTDTTLHRFLVPLEGRMTYDVKFSFDNLNERLIGGGLYSEDNLQRTEGTYFLSIPPRTPDKYLLAFDPFEDQFVAAFLGKDFSSKNKGISETDVQEIVHRQDGGILLIAERNRALERRTGMARTSYDRLTGRYIVDYYYDDLFVASIHPNGKTHWRNILHKRQYSQDDDAVYSSYFLLKTPYNLRLLFNDEIKYENTVSEYVIQGNGHFDRNAVMSTENQKLRLRFTDAIQVASNALIVPSERRNRLKLVKVTY